MLKLGERAPDFTLPDQDGREVRLSDLQDGESLILYFYPADFTPGCTKEACDFRDLHGRLLQVGLKVVGISPQAPDSHRRFRDKYALPFTLLSDVDKVVIKAFGVDGLLGIGVRRATFLLDPRRRVVSTVLADFRVDRHREFMEKVLDAFGG